MIDSKIKVIALDLEGTLISNAMSQFPRPGLHQFLEFCHNNFERVVIFTAVSEERTRMIIRILAEEGDAPIWFADSLEYVVWNGQYKDLKFVTGVDVHEVLLVDDQEAYVHPEQKDQWIPVKEYESPYSQDDDELVFVQDLIKAKIAN
jgi:hypothetical protein